MLDIRVNDIPLDLPPDFSLNLVSTNPILDKDNVARQFSYPYRVPLTPRNRRTRRHSQRLDAKKTAAKVAGDIRFQSHLIARGFVTQLRSGSESEEIAFANEVLDLWKELATFKISDILETVQVGNSVYTEAVWKYDLEESYPNTYSISLEGVTATADADNAGELDAALESLVNQINAVYPGMASRFPGNAWIKLQSDQVNLHPVTQIVSITLDYAVTPAEKNYANIVAHLDDVNATPVETHCFPVITWNSLYTDGGNYAFLGMANRYNDGVFYPNEPNTLRIWHNTIIPCVRVPYILEKIREQIGFTEWRGDVFDGEAIQNLIVVSNYTLDDVRYDRYPDGVVDNILQYHNGFKTEINLNRHVPEITAADFIRAVCATFNLMLEYGDGGLKFTPKLERITPAPVDLSDLVLSAYDRERNYTDGWTLRHAPNPLEQFDPTPDLQPLVHDGGEVITEVPATFGSTVATLDGGNAKMPITQQPGVSDAYDGGKAKSSLPLTFLFYRGLAETSIGDEYPFASFDNLDTGDNEIGEYSLDIQADNGLYALWHKGYIELSNADTLKVEALLPLGTLQNILRFLATRGKFYHPEGHITGVFKSLEYAISPRSLSPVRIEMLVV